MDENLLSREELLSELVKLRNGIRKHRDEKGHDRCQIDDSELYNLLPDGIMADQRLPDDIEFLRNCQRFCSNRRDPNYNPHSELSEPQKQEWDRLVRVANFGLNMGKKTVIVPLELIEAVDRELCRRFKA